MRRLAYNPQITPRAPLAHRGLGQSISDFNALADPSSASFDPLFAGAWGNVNAQLQTEYSALQANGTADPSVFQARISQAKISLETAYSQMSSAFSQGVDPTNIAAAAQSYVIAGKTIVGAVSTVEGLVQAVQSGGAQAGLAVTNAFMGTLIGIAVTSGALTAGLGAAIVGAVGAVLSFLQSAGLFGSPASGPTVCGSTYNGMRTPDFVIHCVPVWADDPNSPRIDPGSPLWRQFPDSSNPTDAAWFAPATTGPGPWRGATFASPAIAPYGLTPDQIALLPRPIDAAWPNYRYLECEMASAPGDFQRAFFAAWKANQAYALNGLKPLPDYEVFLHTLRLWNTSRAPGAPMFLSQIPVTLFEGPCQPGPPYCFSLVQDAIANLKTDDDLLFGTNALRLHTGPVHVVPATPAAAASLKLPPGGSSLAHVTTGAAVAVGTTALGVAAYAAVTHVAFGYAAGKLLDKALDGLKVLGKRVTGR